MKEAKISLYFLTKLQKRSKLLSSARSQGIGFYHGQRQPNVGNSAIPLVHISAYHGESDGSSDGEGNEFRDDGPSGDAQNMSKYPMLSKLGVDLDLSIGVNEISLFQDLSLSRYPNHFKPFLKVRVTVYILATLATTPYFK